jgi:hypothetical protein
MWPPPSCSRFHFNHAAGKLRRMKPLVMFKTLLTQQTAQGAQDVRHIDRR